MQYRNILFIKKIFNKLIHISITIFIYYSLNSCAAYTSTNVKACDKNILLNDQHLVIGKAAKVHLLDGAMIFFSSGFTVRKDMLDGHGLKYDITRNYISKIKRVPLDSVLYVQYYEEESQRIQFWSMGIGSAFVLLGLGFVMLYAALEGLR